MTIDYTCPHCQTEATVATRFRGVSRVCQECGRRLIVPATSGGMAAAASPAQQPNWAVRGALVLAILGALYWLVLPNLLRPTDSAVRMQCANNLKQFTLAMMSYNDKYGALPPAYTIDASGKPLHSWRTLVLPYVEQRGLYDQIRLDEPWDSPHNSQFHAIELYNNHCYASDDPATDTSYMVIVGEDTLFPPGGESPKLYDLQGHADTIMIAEVADGPHWMEPKEAEPGYVVTPGSNHRGGANVAFADGSVRFQLTESLEDIQDMAKVTFSPVLEEP